MNHITRVKFHILFTTFPIATPVQHRGEDSRVSAIFQKSSAPSQTSLQRSIRCKAAFQTAAAYSAADFQRMACAMRRFTIFPETSEAIAFDTIEMKAISKILFR